jgi:hypothetical protein
MKRSLAPLFLALLPLVSLLLPACGGGGDPKALTEAGYEALGTSDNARALEDFDQALAAIGGDTAHPQFLRAKLGAIEAKIKIDPVSAKREFLDLAASSPSKITDKDFSYFGQKFAGASEFLAAIDLLDAGMKMHSESPELKKLQENIKAAAEKAGDKAALDKLAGLGYI